MKYSEMIHLFNQKVWNTAKTLKNHFICKKYKTSFKEKEVETLNILFSSNIFNGEKHETKQKQRKQ